MSSLNELYNAGKKDIWENASVAQLRYLQIIAKLRRVETSLLKQCDMLFIPNDEYLALHCGKDIKQYEYGCYLQSDVCIWTGYLLIPIRDVAGYVRGFAGFHPFHYAEAKEKIRVLHIILTLPRMCFRKVNTYIALGTVMSVRLKMVISFLSMVFSMLQVCGMRDSMLLL